MKIIVHFHCNNNINFRMFFCINVFFCACVAEAEEFRSTRTDVGGDRMRRVIVLANVAIVWPHGIENNQKDAFS